MSTCIIDRPPITEVASGSDESIPRWVVVAENIHKKFVCMFWLDADTEQECRELVVRWFLETDHGIPTKCTIVPISPEVEDFNVSSNDDDVLDFFGQLPHQEEE